MNTKKVYQALLCLSVLLLAGACTKEPTPDNTTTNTTTNNTTNTTTGGGTVAGVDYSIDTSVKLNYTVMLVNGTEFSIGFGKKASGGDLSGAKVSISQGGGTQTKLTDENGLAAFTGFFKGVLTVSISRDDLTAVKYLVTVNSTLSTVKVGKVDVANMIPVFKIKNDPLTATIIGKATYHNDLTNSTRETVPAGTKILASIDASSPAFYNQYLKVVKPYILDSIQSGKIINFSYQTAFYDSTNATGDYKITIPGSVDGLPFIITAPELVDNQKYYENATVGGFNQVRTSRTIFSSTQVPSVVPPAGGAQVTFLPGSGALASATVSGTGQIDKINITSGGSGYTSVPKIVITGGGGSGATANATVTNGVVTAITITSGGSGYTSDPAIAIVSGSGAVISPTIGGGGSIISIQVQNSGSGYTAAPTVTLSAPTLPGGVTATAVASISNGNVTAITITNAGSGYASNPTVTVAAPPSGTTATANAQFSGFQIQSVTIVNGGSNYTGNPSVTFSAPDIPSGTRAQGIATVDVNTGVITGFTLTTPGSGYLFTPTITISAGSGASASASYSGKILTGITVTSAGTDYAFAPKVVITGGGGTGAAATAIVSNGKVVGFTITSAGSGYTSSPTVQLVSGSGAQASVIVSGGKISSINLVNGGSGYTGAPTLVIAANPLSAPGSGATATATVDVASGAVTGITITNQGTGYLGGNVPSVAEPFSTSPAPAINAKSGMIYIKDIHFGTGLRVD